MRKIIFSINMTLDGFIEGPHQELDWTVADGELHDFFANLLSDSDLILFGRVTYNMMKDYWPNASSNPATTAAEQRFADAINPVKKVVYSTTLKDVSWNTRLVKSFDPEEIRLLKEQPGRPILLDGTSLLQQFMKYGLVDEILLVVMPVVIGSGKPLFSSNIQPTKLIYQWSKPFASGAMALSYRVDGNL